MNKLKFYNLLLNHQTDFLMTLNALGVKDAKSRIKNLLDEELFTVVECDKNEIISIKKNSTGEIFTKGFRIYSKKHDIWIDDIYFDSRDLFGTYYSDIFYQNYVRASGGLYHLNEVSLTKEEPKEIEPEHKEIIVDGIIYVPKK